MKTISEKISEVVRHMGRAIALSTSVVEKQRFEVEASDVGVTYDNYMGWNGDRNRIPTGHRVKFTQAHVGKIIEVNTQEGSPWTCWVFINS